MQVCHSISQPTFIIVNARVRLLRDGEHGFIVQKSDVVDCFVDAELAFEAFCLPVEGGEMSVVTAEDEESSVARKSMTIRTQFVEFQIENLGSGCDVDRLANVFLS